MAEEVVDASVVLTADNAQYDAAMQASAGQTEQLAKSVDTLGAKLDKLSKSAGRKLMVVAAADVATITAVTAAYAAYEKQMESLSAQAAVLQKNTTDQNRLFKAYEGTVNSLRGTFAMSTREAAALTQQLTKLSDGTQQVDRLAMTFGKLAAVSGEAPTALAQSVLTLQRSMGMPQRETERFANTLTNLSARTNTSVTAIADFSQSIAPMARQVGMTATEVVGVSTAFIKAGQDGYQAANAFNKILGDIGAATASGSPDLAKYAQLVGVTVENFKAMDKTEAVTRIFETLNRQGPQAITTLNRLGLDGLRTQRAITALAQGGGLRGAIREAQGGDPDALSRGSKEAMDGIIDSLSRTRVALTQTAEEMGANFSGPAKGFVSVVESMSKALQGLANSPLGDIAAWIMGLAGPLAGAAGGMLLMAKGVLAFATANQLLRNSFTHGFQDRRTGTPRETYNPRNFVQNALYGAGGRLGGLFPSRDPNTPSGAARAASWTAGRGLQGVGLLSRLVGAGFNPGYYNPWTGHDPMRDPTERDRMFKAPTFREAVRHGWDATAGQFSASQRLRMEERNLERHPSQANQTRVDQARADWVKHTETLGKSVGEANKQFGGFNQGLKDAGRGFGYMMRNMAGATMGAASTAGSAIGKAGSWAFNQMGGSWLSVGLLGYAGYEMLRDKTSNERVDYSGSGSPYMQAGGINPPGYADTRGSDLRPSPQNRQQALRINPQDTYVASNRELSNSALKGLSREEAAKYLSSQYSLYRKSPQALDELKMDLIGLYGSTGAQLVLGQLESGEVGSPQTFLGRTTYQTGLNDREVLGFDVGPSKGSIAKQIDLGMGMSRDSANIAYQRYGDKALWSERSKGLEEFITGMASGVSETKERSIISGGGFNQMTSTEETYLDRLKDEWDVSSFSEEDFREIRDDLAGAKTSREQFAVFLESIFVDERVNLEERQAMLDSIGADPTLTGSAAVQAFKDVQSDNYRRKPMWKTEGTLDYAMANVRGAQNTKGTPLTMLPEVRRARNSEGNVNAQILAVQAQYEALANQGKSPAEINRILGNIRAQAGSSTLFDYQVSAGAQQWNQQLQSWQMPSMGRTQQFGAQVDMFRSNMAIASGDEQEEQLRQEAMQQFFEQAEAQRQYFVQQLYRQREYNVMRERAEYDYNLSREYAQEDYHRSRMWQEQDYDIARQRAERNFRIMQGRAQQNFNISRRRQEQDHQHQVVLMTENAAKQMMNIYERVAVQRTASAEYILYNAQDQLERMTEQSQNLEELRRRGFSNRTIDQLQLNDPNNAQQLETLLADVRENPELVKRFNRMIAQRIRAARDLVTDESDTEWKEFIRQYRLNRSRALSDFRRVTRQAREDQARSMSDMEKDFRKQLDRQETQYEITMGRQADAYELTMKRSANDLNRAAKEINGNFEEMLTKATEKLSGHAQRQAKIVLREFKDLKNSTTPEAVALMKILADVFNVDYNAPQSAGGRNNGPQRRPRTAGDIGDVLTGGLATGGVVPGWSPGVDNQNYVGPGGQRISLSGGEAIMRPEFTRAVGGEEGVKRLNQAAIHNKFFLGGVMPTQASEINKHSVYDYPTKTWAGDLNDPGSGDMGDPVKAWKRGTVAKVLDIGDQSYGRYIVINHPGGQNSLYAHLSRARVKAGDEVGAGDLIGNVGAYGKATGPHLHFEIDGGSVPMGGSSGYGGSGGGTPTRLSDILKDYYKKPEKAVSRMDGLRPLEAGDISKVINRMARKRWEKWVDRFGRPTSGVMDGTNFDFSGVNAAGGNVALGKKMAAAVGWGGGGYWEALYKLWMAESGWDHLAENPSSGAYGIPQSLPASKMRSAGADYRTNPKTQIEWGLEYIKDRYGGPVRAWKWHQNHNWYGDGAVFNGPHQIGVGERGPEAVIPLNERGAEFVSAILERTRANHSDVRGAHTAGYSQPIAHNLYNTYKIDKSTTFTGAITVQANDTREFLRELQQRQRTAALTQPQLAGSR